MKPFRTDDLGLDQLRAAATQIDRQMAVMVSHRADIVRAIAAIKRREPVIIGEEGHHVVEVAVEEVREGGDPDFVEQVFRRVSVMYEDLEAFETRDHPDRILTAPQPLG